MTTKKGNELNKTHSVANERQIILTEISRIVCFGTPQSDRLGERHNVVTFSLIDALTVGHDVHVIKHFKYFCGRCMYGADDSSASVCDSSQKFYAL
jgi:hypothetical protein